MDQLHIEFEQHRQFMELVTPEVEEHMKGLAKSYEDATNGGLFADELVQTTLTMMYGYAHPAPTDKYRRGPLKGQPRQPQPITNMLHLSSVVMSRIYRNYCGREQDMDMSLGSIPEAWADSPPVFLTTAPEQDRRMVERDVQNALATLSPREQTIARLFYFDGLNATEVASRLGVKHHWVVIRTLNRIHEKLRGLLADYGPERLSDKTLREKSA